MQEIDVNNPKAVRDRLLELMLAAPLPEEAKDEFTRDIADWSKAMQTFFRLAWSEPQDRTPRNPVVGGVSFPPFSEMLNPSNAASVPSCFRRIVHKHFSYFSNRAADLLVNKYDFMFQFSVFFSELDKIVYGDACYQAHNAFCEVAHQYKYYRKHDWFLHPASRLRDWLIFRFLTDDFKSSCKAVSKQLYHMEHGEPRTDRTECNHVKMSRLLDEREYQEYFLNPRGAATKVASETPTEDFGDEVPIARAAEICKVQYNTIKNWETNGPSKAAEGYPGRRNLEKLIRFAKVYRLRVGLPSLESEAEAKFRGR